VAAVCAVGAADSHFISAALSFGWDTSKCQRTAWNDSVCAVTVAGLTTGTSTQASETRAVNPPSRPTIPQIFGADLLRILQSANEIGADFPLGVAATHRKDEDGVAAIEPASHQPVAIRRLPAVVVDARRQFGHVVGGRVAFHPGDLAEIIDGVRSVARAAADSEEKDSAAFRADLDEQAEQALDRLAIELLRNLNRLS